MSADDLYVEIDKILEAKIKADADADAADAPRRELVDFVVEYYLEGLGSMHLAQQKLYGMLMFIQTAERHDMLSTKAHLFARFLEFCEYDKALPLPMLNLVLRAKSLAQPNLTRVKQEPVKEPGPKSGRGKHDRSSLMTVQSGIGGPPASYVESVIPVSAAFDAGLRALPKNSTGLRELFSSLARSAEMDMVDQRRGGREFMVLILLVQDRLQRQKAPRMRDLIQRAEKRDNITTEEFREAMKDGNLGDVDPSIWRPKLCPISHGLPTSNISNDAFLDFLGGGSGGRVSKGATVTESVFLQAVADAAIADCIDRTVFLRRIWDRRMHDRGASNLGGSLEYPDFKSVFSSAEPDLPAVQVRALFTASVEASRACVQGEDHVPVLGSLKPAISGLYGGEVVTFKLLLNACMRRGLFVSERAPKAVNEGKLVMTLSSPSSPTAGASEGGGTLGRSGGRSRGADRSRNKGRS